jgi:serine/threonine-protein kinase
MCIRDSLNQELNDQYTGNTGSPAYMAPERFYGQYSLTSDLYSVGILLFELLAGYRPFSGTPTELMSAHLNRPVQIPDTVPAAWHSFLLTALQKLSARRFRSAREMRMVLESIAATEEASSWHDRRTADYLLLEPIPSTAPLPLQSQKQELFPSPVTALAATQSDSRGASVQPDYLYGVIGQRISRWIVEPDAAGINLKSRSWLADVSPSVQSPDTSLVQGIFPRPQGCFVVTQQLIGLIPVPPVSESGETILKLSPQTVFEFEPNLQRTSVAIEPSGRWMATLMVKPDPDPDLNPDLDPNLEPPAVMGTLRFQALPGSHADFSLAPYPIPVSLKGSNVASLQLLTLDSRHVAVVAETTTPPSDTTQLAQRVQSKTTSGTMLRVFTRRGTLVSTLNLPILGSKFELTLTPYQLMAVDRQNPHSVLLIDLKPYRISRLGVDIMPDDLLATPWGYLFADQQGAIVAIDREGRHLGQLQTGLPITAVAFMSPHRLWVATQQEQQGMLHAVDLRESGLDLLF